MAIEVLVPPLGQTVDTLKLVSWFKQEGDPVRQGEPLFSVETDKATLDVEAPGSGVLRQITAQAGEDVKVLSAIGIIEEPGEHQEPKEAAGGAGSSARRFSSPRARALAEREGVAIEDVTPTGPEGAVVERDVRAYLASHKAKNQTAKTLEPPEPASITPVARRIADEMGLDWRTLRGTGPRGQVTREDVAEALAARETSPSTAPAPEQEAEEVIPLAGIRAVVAARMAQSHLGTAPVTLTTETDATALVRLRKDLIADGVPVAYGDLLIAIAARALREHPRLNASIRDDKITIWRRADIALAVDTERGLLAPVVRNAGAKGLSELAAETRGLAERARSGRCLPEELAGGTFTITNLGMFGIDAFTPIINLPECAILGVGRIKTEPAWIDGRVEPRDKMWLSLTFDHRLVDGGPAARFLARIAELVEKPHLLLT